MKKQKSSGPIVRRFRHCIHPCLSKFHYLMLKRRQSPKNTSPNIYSFAFVTVVRWPVREQRSSTHWIPPHYPYGPDDLYPELFNTSIRAALRSGDWKIITGFPFAGFISECFSSFSCILKSVLRFSGGSRFFHTDAPTSEEVPTYYLVSFHLKLHENKNILAGDTSLVPHRSANTVDIFLRMVQWSW